MKFPNSQTSRLYSESPIFPSSALTVAIFRQEFMIAVRTRKWQPTPVFLPGEYHGQRSLVGCSPWGPTESDTTEATCGGGGRTRIVRICVFVICTIFRQRGREREYMQSMFITEPLGNI